MSSLFPDHLIAKAEEISHHEEKRPTGSSERNLIAIIYTQSAKQAPVPALKQLKLRMQDKKDHGKASAYQQKPVKGQKYYK